jgi:uncharacterized membrane protein YqaE (UPF0057 family)
MILFLCYFCPPLAVLCMGRPFSAVMNCFFTMLLWAPGVGHALVHYADYRGGKHVKTLTRAINNPAHTRQPRASSPRIKKEVVAVAPVYDSPHVGKNGTRFRAKSN